MYERDASPCTVCMQGQTVTVHIQYVLFQPKSCGLLKTYWHHPCTLTCTCSYNCYHYLSLLELKFQRT